MQSDSRMAELTVLIENIVAEVLNKSYGKQTATWAENYALPSLYVSRGAWGDYGSGLQVAGSVYNFGRSLQNINAADFHLNEKNKTISDLNKFGKTLSGLAGVYNAYQTGDPIGGALAGAELGGVYGAIAGFLIGLFSPGIDKWYRPKFKPAKRAFDKLFRMDRGERDEYYMPDSYYFRTGYQGPQKIIVEVGNNQFDDHIRESLTNSYASQLQRGLVF